MAFGVDYTGFLDSFDTGKVVGTSAQKDAKERANAFLGTAMVGGAGVDTIGQMRAKEILGEAQQSAQSTTDTAGAVSGGLDFLGNVGSFGAAGGFGKTTDFSQPVFGAPGARETIGGYDSFETFNPSEIPGLRTPIPLR